MRKYAILITIAVVAVAAAAFLAVRTACFPETDARPAAAGADNGPWDKTLDGITFLGTAEIPGTAADMSGLTDSLEEGTPHNRLGGFSGLAYTGSDSRYIVLPDRGPADGAASFHCRFHIMDIEIIPDKTPAVHVKLISTVLLTNEHGENFIGLSSKFDSADSRRGLRLDPEGACIGRNGEVFISDEYGPFVMEFDKNGRILRFMDVPSEFCVKHPADSKKAELAANKTGRATNKGFEGIAISPDGRKLYALPQAPLIQDRRQGQCNCRMLELEIATGAARQYAVPLASTTMYFNELLSVGDGRFLTIERDEHAGNSAKRKRIVLLDMRGATDISSVRSLPADLPAEIKPVRKLPLINMLEDRFGLAGPNFPNKVEGLALGPKLPDGRNILLIAADNDFIAGCPTYIWAFAVPDEAMAPLGVQAFITDAGGSQQVICEGRGEICTVFGPVRRTSTACPPRKSSR